QAQFLAEQGAAAIDVRHIAQHPRPEAQRVERQAVARQRRLALRAADQIVPIIAVEVLPRDLDELMQVLETKVQQLVGHRRGYLVGWKTGSTLTEGRETGNQPLSASHSANLPFPRGSGYDAGLKRPREEETRPMSHRVLTPDSHGDETMKIAHDMLPDGLELVTAPHGRPEFWNLLKDADFYIGAGQFKHGPEFYQQAPKLKLVQTLSAGYNTYDLEAARATGVPICNNGDVNRMTTDQEDALGVRFVLLPELLKTSDIVSLHVPLDLSTHNLIGERELSLMKPTAILINTCRGPVVEEKALYQALRDEKIMGAGLDVMREEPPQPDHELFSLKNAIFSPHSAGPTWDNHPKRWRNAFDNCERVARGSKPFWIVPELR